ncbi:MAG: hypothetical protein ACLFS8_02625, partial [Clostridia bacterium]
TRIITAGRITLAVTLLAVGLGFLVYNVFGINLIRYLRLFWPTVLMFLGMELLWRQSEADRAPGRVRVRLDGWALLLLFVLVFVVVLGGFPAVMRRAPYWGRWLR